MSGLTPIAQARAAESRRRLALETPRLRRAIERRQRVTFWGERYTITPRLVDRVFGDGRRLLAIEPLNTRPNYYVVRIGSDQDPSDEAGDYYMLNDIMEAIEDQFGRRHPTDDDGNELDEPWPAADFSVGVAWPEAYWPAGWAPPYTSIRGARP